LEFLQWLAATAGLQRRHVVVGQPDRRVGGDEQRGTFAGGAQAASLSSCASSIHATGRDAPKLVSIASSFQPAPSDK
jgi:hypothetical protein